MAIPAFALVDKMRWALFLHHHGFRTLRDHSYKRAREHLFWLFENPYSGVMTSRDEQKKRWRRVEQFSKHVRQWMLCVIVASERPANEVASRTVAVHQGQGYYKHAFIDAEARRLGIRADKRPGATAATVPGGAGASGPGQGLMTTHALHQVSTNIYSGMWVDGVVGTLVRAFQGLTEEQRLEHVQQKLSEPEQAREQELAYRVYSRWGQMHWNCQYCAFKCVCPSVVDAETMETTERPRKNDRVIVVGGREEVRGRRGHLVGIDVGDDDGFVKLEAEMGVEGGTEGGTVIVVDMGSLRKLA